MEWHEPSMSSYVVALFALKTLCIYAYYSTDFEVHRNWLAVTHSLPFKRWYYENTSQWTLDYPPGFAWFEYFLSQFAKQIDPKMVEISAKPYTSLATVHFQRFTVIITDFVYVMACFIWYKMHNNRLLSKSLFLLLVLNVGLFYVDSIHFQYNGFLFGILLLSFLCIYKNYMVLGFALYIILLHMKHLFLYLAPAYAAYFLVFFIYPFDDVNSSLKIAFHRTLKLFAVVLGISSISLGPFVYAGQMKQLISRLFPFGRGLTHAYWAPNFWALYNFCDFILYHLLRKLNFLSFDKKITYTSGLVQEVIHVLLPQISPLISFLAVILNMLPFCISLLHGRNFNTFLKLIVGCAFSSFLFGWHVHEKAVLTVIIPLTILAVRDGRYAKIFFLFSVFGHYSLFPLLFRPFETVLKYCTFLLYTIFTYLTMIHVHESSSHLPFMSLFETCYLMGICIVECFLYVAPVFPKLSNLSYLPLMVQSLRVNGVINIEERQLFLIDSSECSFNVSEISLLALSLALLSIHFRTKCQRREKRGAACKHLYGFQDRPSSAGELERNRRKRSRRPHPAGRYTYINKLEKKKSQS
ncbi:putative dolichyl pyrophosphate Glc1Man9GlcNAc2 alpha-1,3-glucosyltransferase [Trichinella pseudospiralis]|uniref:Alpha-1,3-glucosyltransferase n=1 Tax=Trichinella pseudospiralis TaxID=6337 RepID=A0A0V0XHV0_TRIPS|nr:putative dolichyl pyrophosphate Glc1Man9GlcNAc2 alpha-1,3-glucosyltransferase [Trichinella pseudospiralis]